MQCTLLIPHLWWPRDAGEEAYRDLALPELQILLARANHRRFPGIDMGTWLCQAFEVQRQSDWPVAPLTLTIDGGDPGEAYWLRADPVHLRPHRNQLLLADSNAFTVSRNESEQVTAVLNRYFAAEGLQFSAPCPERWYLRIQADPGIVTHPLDEVAGGDINRFLPTGRNALHWHRILNEIQMLLHENAVNEAREAKGDLPINSLWLWGGGRRMAVPGRHFSALWSDEALALALASHSDTHAASAGPNGTSWMRSLRGTANAQGAHLLVLTQLASAVHRGGLPAWRHEVSELNRLWIAPLLAALRDRSITELALVAPGRVSCERFDLARRDLFKFWRPMRPLMAYAPATPQ